MKDRTKQTKKKNDNNYIPNIYIYNIDLLSNKGLILI